MNATRKEQMRAYRAACRKRNRDKWLASKKRYRERNREKILAYKRKWRAANPGREIRRYKLTPEKRRIAKKRSRLKNRESFRRMQNGQLQRQRAGLTDHYVKNLLRHYGIKSPTINQIESCRQRIQLKRAAQTFKLFHAAQVLSSLSQT
jgi:anthranilate/para-aminobenzoate synthase component I